jgi:hypothetical protein
MVSGVQVCVLHTSEFDGLYAQGVRIEPGYGFAFTRTFSLAAYVDRLEEVTARHGRDSPAGRLTKPLGNMVYGKFGQRPDRWQLMFSAEQPGDDWYPYFSDSGEDVLGVWERQTVRNSSGMHVDIASHITGYARSQLLTLWAYLDSIGYFVARAHTDSLTVDRDPREDIETDDEIFGSWKYEGVWHDGIVVGPNAYAADDAAKVAGVSEPTREQVAALYAGQVVELSQQQKAPRRGWRRGEETVTKRLQA